MAENTAKRPDYEKIGRDMAKGDPTDDPWASEGLVCPNHADDKTAAPPAP